MATEVGLRVATWSLRRNFGGRPLLSSVVLGTVTACVACLGGAWAAAGLQVADTLSLLLS